MLDFILLALGLGFFASVLGALLGSPPAARAAELSPASR